MPNNIRYDEMMKGRFVDNDAPNRQPINFGKKKKNGGFSDESRARLSAEAAEDQATLTAQESDPRLQQAMAVQARSRKAEALENAKRARASALRRR
jgi:hypothetical protein